MVFPLRFRPPSPALWQGLIACALVGLHIALYLYFSPKTGFLHRYEDGASRWDSNFYSSIITYGYSFPYPPTPALPPSTAFFPLYPLLGAGLRAGIGVSDRMALLIVSQLAAVCAWFVFLQFQRHLKIALLLRVATCVLLWTFPASFFLVLGYTESLFFLAFVGMVYGSMALEGRSRIAITGLSAFVMACTRVIGVPLLVYPIVASFFVPVRLGRSRIRTIIEGACASLIGSLGFIAYMLYTHVRFGRWDAFIVSQGAWDHGERARDIILRVLSLPDPSFLVLYSWTNPAFLEAIPVLVTQLFLYAFLFTAIVDVALHAFHHRDPGMVQRLVWYAMCVSMIITYLVSVGSTGLFVNMSMTRYALMAYPWLLLAWAWMLSHSKSRPLQWAFCVVAVLVAVPSLLLQLHMLSLILRTDLFVG